MRYPLLFLLLLLCSLSYAQLNTTLIAQLEYDEELSDIWGYVAPDGTEYALVGVTSGVSIVSLEDPANPQQVAYVPGASSTWRDLKTFGDFAYVTTDQSGTKEGLLVIDLRELPNSVSSFNWRPALNGQDTLNRCHNLYIDESGVAYLAGCNINNGGMVFVDVASTPGQPAFIDFAAPVYAHDVFTRDNRMYASEIFLGQVAIYDVGEKDDVQLLATQPTPFSFTHNAWSSPDDRYLFTTDERPNAPVAAYDITDLDNIRPLDQYRPVTSIGQGVIPHNVYTKDNWVLISYYVDGARILDATRPDNLVEVAFYDTYDGDREGFHGAWGLYPYLPSGNLIVSDIDNGLFVLQVDYQRASYLEGKVTNEANGSAIQNVAVEILTDEPNAASTDAVGDYKTGLAEPGNYQVSFRHPEYYPKTLEVSIAQGEVTNLDVTLERKKQFAISGVAIDELDQSPVGGTQVLVVNEDFTYRASSDEDGRFSLDGVFEGNYQVVAVAWGYFHRNLGDVQIDEDASLTIMMETGYQDDFIFDLGWSTEGDASDGQWERGVPDGVRLGSDFFISPSADIESDFGIQCYVTGLGGGNPGANDVDNGTVRLISPFFDLTGYEAPELSYYLWFFNNFGNSTANDTLRVYLTNGQDTIQLEEVSESRSGWRPPSTFALNELISLSSEMQLIVETSDLSESGHVVEAGFDAFLVRDATLTSTDKLSENAIELEVFPNPFANQFTIRYDLKTSQGGHGSLQVYNALGQSVLQTPIEAATGTLELGQSWRAGMYYLVLEWNGKKSTAVKIIKGR